MAIFTYIGGVNVGWIFTGSLDPVVARTAVAANPCMIEGGI